MTEQSNPGVNQPLETTQPTPHPENGYLRMPLQRLDLIKQRTGVNYLSPRPLWPEAYFAFVYLDDQPENAGDPAQMAVSIEQIQNGTSNQPEIVGVETYVKSRHEQLAIDFSQPHLGLETQHQVAFGDRQVATLNPPEKTTPESEYVVLPACYPIPKYLQQDVSPVIKREHLYGRPEENLSQEQLEDRWVEMIDHIDQVLRDGVDGQKLEIIEDIGSLYLTRIYLMALLKGHSEAELKQMWQQGQQEKDTYAQQAFGLVDAVDANDSYPLWYAFSKIMAGNNGHLVGKLDVEEENLVAASGDQVLVLIIDQNDQGDVYVYFNFERSPQAGGRLMAIAPGGGKEKDETPEVAGLRETHQELGIRGQMTLLRQGLQQKGVWFEQTDLCLLQRPYNEGKSGGDELFGVKVVSSKLMSEFEHEVLAGHIQDLRLLAMLAEALVQKSGIESGLVLEDPKHVRSIVRQQRLEEQVNLAGHLGEDTQQQLKTALEAQMTEEPINYSQETQTKFDEVYSPEAVNQGPPEEKLEKNIKAFTNADKRAFLKRFSISAEHTAAVDTAFSDFSQKIGLIFSGEIDVNDPDILRRAYIQHHTYIAGDLGRHMGLDKDGIEAIQTTLETQDTEDAIRTQLATLGDLPEGIDWMFSPLNDKAILKNLPPLLIYKITREFGEKLGVTPDRINEIISLADGPDPDAKIKALLEANNESSVAQVIDLIGRLNHLAWQVSLVAEDRYVDRFNDQTQTPMFGTFDDMKRQVVASHGQDRGMYIIAKDYDQDRGAMRFVQSFPDQSRPSTE